MECWLLTAAHNKAVPDYRQLPTTDGASKHVLWIPLGGTLAQLLCQV